VKKLLIGLICILCLGTAFMTVQAAEEPIIEEIIILGLTRTSEQMVQQQLPFAVGDRWHEEYRAWTLQRLRMTDKFSPAPLRVITDPLPTGGVRVTVRVSDPAVWYKDPIELVASSGISLIFGQVNLPLYNPGGLGQNFYLSGSWGSYQHLGLRITRPVGPGVLTLRGRHIDYQSPFYHEQGLKLAGDYKSWLHPNWRLEAGTEFWRGALDGGDMQILFPQLAAYSNDPLRGEVKMGLGIPLGDISPFFRVHSQVMGEYGPLIGLLRGGTVIGDEAPLNYLFHTGHFGLLPLRGQGLELTRDYLLTTVELHWQQGQLIPILFLDGGFYRPGGEGGVINIGAGLGVETPMGVIRLDLGWNPLRGTTAFNFGFGHSFQPPF